MDHFERKISYMSSRIREQYGHCQLPVGKGHNKIKKFLLSYLGKLVLEGCQGNFLIKSFYYPRYIGEICFVKTIIHHINFSLVNIKIIKQLLI